MPVVRPSCKADGSPAAGTDPWATRPSLTSAWLYFFSFGFLGSSEFGALTVEGLSWELRIASTNAY